MHWQHSRQLVLCGWFLIVNNNDDDVSLSVIRFDNYSTNGYWWSSCIKWQQHSSSYSRTVRMSSILMRSAVCTVCTTMSWIVNLKREYQMTLYGVLVGNGRCAADMVTHIHVCRSYTGMRWHIASTTTARDQFAFLFFSHLPFLFHESHLLNGILPFKWRDKIFIWEWNRLHSGCDHFSQNGLTKIYN